MNKIILISTIIVVVVAVVVVVVVTTSKSASASASVSAPTLGRTSAPTSAPTLAKTSAPTIDPTLLNSKANLSGALFSGDVTVPNLYITGSLYGPIRAGDNRLVKPSDQSPGTIGFSFGQYSNGGSGGGGWSDCLNFNTYVDGSGGNSNLLMLNKNGIGMRVFQGGFQSSDVYSTYADSLMIDSQNVLLNTIPSSTVPAKKILTLDDSNKLKTAQGFGLVSIFELNAQYKSSGGWETDSLKRNAFRVSVPNQPVLFSGHVSGRINSSDQLVEITITFNINGSQGRIIQSIKFWINPATYHTPIPINFVKNFLDPGSYDVTISKSSNLVTDSNDVCYLNATILF